MTLTVRSATVTGATTKGSALTHAELDENFNHLANASGITFTPSGIGSLTMASRDAQAKMREVKTSADISGGSPVGLTAIGADAFAALTTGVNLTAIGADAMEAATDAEDSVAVGTVALAQGTGFRWSVAVGHSAGLVATDGTDYLTAVGYQAAQGLETGIRNTAIGAKALLLGTSANDNTCVGWETGRNATGTGNVLVGFQAGLDQTSANFNVSIGYQAGEDVTGSDNTLIGKQAGTDYTTGVENTFVGDNAGNAVISGTPARTGSRNVAIGRLAGPNVETISDTVCVGSDAVTKKGSSGKYGNALTDTTISGRLHSTQTLTDVTTAGNHTYTVAQFRNGVITRTGPSGPFNDATPTAAAIVDIIPGCEVGSGFEIYITNNSGQTLTMLAGTNVTLAGTTTVATGQTRLYKVRVTNITASSEAVTVQGVFTAAV